MYACMYSHKYILSHKQIHVQTKYFHMKYIHSLILIIISKEDKWRVNPFLKIKKKEKNTECIDSPMRQAAVNIKAKKVKASHS